MTHAAEPAPATTDTAPDVIRRLFDAQAPRALALRGSTAAERVAKLKRLRAALFARREAIHAACHADFAKPAAEVDATEILPVAAEAHQAIRRLKSWMKPRRKTPTLLTFGTSAAVRTEPRGRCLLISPWNYPVNLTLGPLVSAIAAGNTVIVKPSELTPHCAALIAELVADLFEPEEITVVQGAVDTAQTLLALPFDHIFFTGSPAVGRIVMAAAARHLTSVTLELGGKSPVIVDRTAKLARAARSLVWGKFANNGQTCIAPDHVYVHADIRDAFVTACRDALADLYGSAGAIADNPDYCRLVNDAHYRRVRGLIEDAVERGAERPVGGLPTQADRFIEPTILTDVDEDARIMTEEIFGPVLPVLTFETVDAPIAAINARPKPLALYIYAEDDAFIEDVLQRTTAGGTCINQTMLQFLHGHLPFGGVNNSGIGRSHGYEGYLAFSHQRSVLRDRFSLTHWFHPPYRAFTRAFIRLAMRWLS